MGLIWLLISMILFILYQKICMLPYDATVDTSEKGGSICEEGWIHHDKYCYKMGKEELNWSAADSKCAMMGGHLATVHSKEQNDFFEVLSIRTDVGYWWFGLHDQDSDGIFSWVDKTDVDYTNWRSEEPYGDYDSGNCVAISFLHRQDNHGQWFVLPCNNKIPYLCQMQTTATVNTVTEIDASTYLIQDTTVDNVSKKEGPSCEDGWIYKDQYCFKMEKTLWSWTYASNECKKMNGNLVSIHSEKQNDNLENIAKETGVDYWWIGLHDKELDNTFSWDDNSDLNYTKWRRGEPDGGFGSGDCVAISFFADGITFGLWFVLPCLRSLPYLCQKQPVATIITTEAKTETTVSTNTATESEAETTVATIITTEAETQTTHLIQDTTVDEVPKKEGHSCDDGWIYKDQYCFKLEKSQWSWSYASNECKEMGGNLVSIHSEKQNDNLKNIATETGADFLWIGLHDLDLDNKFSWDDNSDLNYTKWGPGEPDGRPGYGDCVAISFIARRIIYGLWFVFPCRRPLPYLCQKQSKSTSKTTATETETTTSITENAKLEERAGIISVTTIVITIIVIIIFMALVGGILYYKRFYIQDQRPKEGKVFFRKNKRIAKPSMDFIIEPNKTR